MNTKAILERILEDQNLTVRDLANLLGYPESKLYCVKQGKTKTFSKELLELISNRFPNYSRVWLMTGMGDITVTHPSAPCSIIMGTMFKMSRMLSARTL